MTEAGPITAAKIDPAAILPLPADRPVKNRIFVLVLQHPQEKKEALATAGLTVAQFARADMRVGLSWPNLKRALGREADPKRWAVLYLGSNTNRPGESTPVVQVVDRQGQPLPDQVSSLSHLDGLILLDGTWSQAKTLWWRNPWLLKCRRVVLNPPFRSAYGALRREPRRESLSTIEAAALCLSTLEGKPELYELATQPFRELIARERRPARPSQKSNPPAVAVETPEAEPS